MYCCVNVCVCDLDDDDLKMCWGMRIKFTRASVDVSRRMVLKFKCLVVDWNYVFCGVVCEFRVVVVVCGVLSDVEFGVDGL